MLLLLLLLFVVIVIVSGSGHPGHLCPAGPGLCTESTKFGRKTKQKTNGFKNISTKPANSVFVVFKLGLTYSDLNHFTISNLVLEYFVELWPVCPCSASSHSMSPISQTDERYLSELWCMLDTIQECKFVFSNHYQGSIDFNTVNIHCTVFLGIHSTGNRDDTEWYDLQGPYYPIHSPGSVLLPEGQYF